MPDNGVTKIRFLGATRQVGRSGIAVSNGGRQLLLDYGALIGKEEPSFPVHVPPRDVEAVILTHAHLDHSGGIPLFHLNSQTPIYATPITLELSDILIKDFVNLAGYYLPYESRELDSMLKSSVAVEYGDAVEIGGVKVRFIDAGHIPGSFQAILETSGGKRLVYTGDINLVNTKLLSRASTDYGPAECIIVEATYANEDHPERRELEAEFVSRVREVVERGGTVLVPAFSVGRSQEVLCILADYGFEYPVFVDGMARQVNEVLLQYPRFLRDYKLLRGALENARWIYSWRERKEAINRPGVLISPAGMLKGGAASYYVEKVAKKPRNAIFLVSFQVPGTPGRVLLEERKIFVRGKAERVEAEIERFDFSSHCGRRELQALLRSLDGSPTIFIVHGTPENCESLAEMARKEAGLKALVPSAGDVYKF